MQLRSVLQVACCVKCLPLGWVSPHALQRFSDTDDKVEDDDGEVVVVVAICCKTVVGKCANYVAIALSVAVVVVDVAIVAAE